MHYIKKGSNGNGEQEKVSGFSQHLKQTNYEADFYDVKVLFEKGISECENLKGIIQCFKQWSKKIKTTF